MLEIADHFPALFELNKDGAPNGHIPITAYLSFLADRRRHSVWLRCNSDEQRAQRQRRQRRVPWKTSIISGVKGLSLNAFQNYLSMTIGLINQVFQLTAAII